MQKLLLRTKISNLSIKQLTLSWLFNKELKFHNFNSLLNLWRWLKIKIKTDIYEIENIGDNLEILIHHDNTIRCKTVRENEIVEFTHLELDKQDKEGDIEVTVTKNSITVKEIGEGGKVISKKHSFLNQKTKITCLPPYLIDLIKIGDCIWV